MISSSDSSSSNIDSETQPVKEKEVSPLFQEFLEKLDTFPTPEEKITHGLSFMRTSISQEGSPRFREFWEARRLILPMFKENLNPAIRSNLWNEYIELTVEARRLKEILEEQSVFAMEQIDLAIQALESDLNNFSQLLASTKELELSEDSHMIRKKSDVYGRIQRELNLLNTLASRLNGLRKEIIKTDMRIRFKTKFFKRLSQLGDQIFPKRKEMIEKVSGEFEKDIDQFVGAHFQESGVVGAPYYALREEIKSLQSAAKLFTLNSTVFTRTRLKLSECWDQVKVLEKEHKSKMHEKRQASSQQREAVQEQIDALKGKEISFQELSREIDAVLQEMRNIELTREDVIYLKNELQALKEPHLQEQERRAKELEAAEKEKLRVKREEIIKIKDVISELAQNGESMELEALEKEYETIQERIKSLNLSKMEKQQIDRSVRPLKDLLADKKEHSLLNLSEDDKKTLENLKTVLGQKKARRQEIKSQLEVYRKTLGGSSLDFEKAMQYQELVEQERERLEKANRGVEEIEEKIRQVES